ncbi:MAG: glucosaminidase domain-containing protein [Bacteroidales bacterium]
MGRLQAYLILIVLIAGLNSCRSTRPVVYTPPPGGSGNPAQSYINKYSGMAISEMKRTGIPASITLAQGLIESDMGRSSLAVQANNHFGIKCHSDWNGPVMRKNDDRRNECFRKYRNVEESYRDHSDFLVNGSRYDFLFELKSDDYRGWARGLKKAGYATNPDYANMLIRKIEEYGLDNYDRKDYSATVRQTVGGRNDVPPDTSARKEAVVSTNSVYTAPISEQVSVTLPGSVMETNRVQYIVAGKSDTRESIESRHKLLSWELAKYNELPDDFEPTPGQILYLQPKRDKAEAGKETHVVKDGETLYSISQKYAVKVSRLYLLNRIRKGEEPTPGEKIYLRSMKPVN